MSAFPSLHHFKPNFRKQLMNDHPDLFPTMSSLDRYMDNMNKLSQIQRTLHNFLSGGLKVAEECAAGDERCATEHFEEAVAKAPTQRADQIPYLFEGDIVLSERQMEGLLKWHL